MAGQPAVGSPNPNPNTRITAQQDSAITNLPDGAAGLTADCKSSLDSLAGAETDQERLQGVIHNELFPAANEIDQAGTYPRAILRQIVKFGALASLRPLPDPAIAADSAIAATTHQGRALLAIVKHSELIGQACANTAFCLWCQSALAWYLINTDNQKLRQQYLAGVLDGTILGGTALSNPIKSLVGLEQLGLSGTAIAGRYQVAGVVPWVSNVAANHPFGIVFRVKQQAPVMALVSDAMAGLTIRENDNFVVLQGSATVSALFAKVWIDPDHILALDANAFLPRIRPGFIILQLGIGLGLIMAAKRMIAESRRAAVHTAGTTILTAAQIDDKYAEIWQRLEKMLSSSPDLGAIDIKQIFQLRLDIAELAITASTSSQLFLGGSSLRSNSRSQRLLREAAFFGVLTPSIRHLNFELADK